MSARPIISEVVALIDRECDRRGLSEVNALHRRIEELEEQLARARRQMVPYKVFPPVLRLTALEQLILKRLLTAVPRVVTYESLLEIAIDIRRRDLTKNSLCVAVCKIRKKLDGRVTIAHCRETGYSVDKDSAIFLRRMLDGEAA